MYPLHRGRRPYTGGKAPRRLATKAARRNAPTFGGVKGPGDLRDLCEGIPLDALIPDNPFQESMLQLLDDEKLTDVVFHVREQETGDNPTIIRAHRCVLQACAPALLELCKEYTATTPVPISGIKPEVFRRVIHYVYGGHLPEDEEEELNFPWREIIEAAHMFEISSLKLKAEAEYTDCTDITLENVVDNFYFADTRKCALLKERVMHFMHIFREELLKKIPFNDGLQSESMFHDFLAGSVMFDSDYGSDEFNYDSECDSPSKIRRLPVDVLRRKLHAKGLDIDGTREMLVTSLENSYKSAGKRKRAEDDVSDDGDVSDADDG